MEKGTELREDGTLRATQLGIFVLRWITFFTKCIIVWAGQRFYCFVFPGAFRFPATFLFYTLGHLSCDEVGEGDRDWRKKPS